MKIFIAVLGEYSEVIRWLGATSKWFLKSREHCWISWRGCFKELGNFKSFNFGNCNVGIKSNIEGFCSPIAERVGWKTCWTNLCKQCKLPSDSIVEFFTTLCGVSAEELKQTSARSLYVRSMYVWIHTSVRPYLCETEIMVDLWIIFVSTYGYMHLWNFLCIW